MSYTVQMVFDEAIHILDAQNESTGSTHTADTKEYELRTPNIVNSFLNALYPYSDTYSPEGGKRAVLDHVTSLEDELNLDGFICMSVLPYGLAWKLVAEENPELAADCRLTYREMYASLVTGGIVASIEPIEDCYGGIEFGQFSRWD